MAESSICSESSSSAARTLLCQQPQRPTRQQGEKSWRAGSWQRSRHLGALAADGLPRAQDRGLGHGRSFPGTDRRLLQVGDAAATGWATKQEEQGSKCQAASGFGGNGPV